MTLQRTSESQLMAELELAGARFKGKAMHCLFPENHRNGDRNPSASVYCGKDGTWRWRCQACGKGGDVFDVMALRTGRPLAEILKENTQGNHQPTKPAQPEKMSFPDIDSFSWYMAQKYGGSLEALHEYCTSDGSPAFSVARWRIGPDKKTIRPLVHHDGALVMSFPDGKRVLYRMLDIAKAKTLIVCEGELKCDVLGEYGFPATTSSGGCKSAAETDWAPISNRQVIIWPDHDLPGKAYADEVRQILESQGCAVKIIDPSLLDLKEGEDVVDYIRQLRNAGFDENAIKQNLINVFKTKTLSVGPAAELDSYYAAILEGRYKNIKTGFITLDRIIQIMPESLIIFCGSPGASKSLLMLQLMAYWIEQDIRAACFMLERSKPFHLSRVIAQLAGESKMTRLEWVQANPDLVREYTAQHREKIDAIGRSLWTAGDKGIAQGDLISWAQQRAQSGHKILIIDPATLAERRDEPYRADEVFVQGLKGIATKYKCSVVVVLHPQKGMIVNPDLSTVAGGAVYGRAADNVLWLDHHSEPKKSTVAIADGFSATEEVEHNRTLVILKSRDGSGTFAKIAFQLSSENLKLSEIGLILKKKH